MSQRSYQIVSGVLFSLVAVAHLLRLVYQLPIEVDGKTVPMLLSWIGFIVPASLAVWAVLLVRSHDAA